MSSGKQKEIIKDEVDSSSSELSDSDAKQEKAKKGLALAQSDDRLWDSDTDFELDSSSSSITRFADRMKLPTTTPVCLAFEDLGYFIRKRPPLTLKHLWTSCKWRQNPFRKERKDVVRPMSGHFLPGRLVAIMGPSGAGKTTLLNLLSGRLKGKKHNVSGQVLINGKRRTSSTFKTISAYVMQDDSMLGNLTPRELLTYAARLRLPRTMTYKEKKMRVKAVLAQLGLQDVADTKVGVPGEKRGISGGERRRVSIGLELVTNPMVLFLDEPTSGLDSATAETVVRILKALALQGRTIICTIHQPSSEIFQLFDDVYLMAAGELVYSGPVRKVTEYFAELDYPCPSYTNPADHVMRLLTNSEDVVSKEPLQERLARFVEHKRNLAVDTLIPIQEADKYLRKAISLSEIPKITDKRPFFPMVFWLLLCRAFTQYRRDPGVTYQRLMKNVVLAVVTGLLFLQTNSNQKGIVDRMSVIFMLLVVAVIATGNSILYIFPLERSLFLREYRNGMYSVLAYYLSKSWADLPFNIVIPIIFATISYWLIGLREDAGAFFIYVTVTVIISNIAQSMALLVSVALDLRVSLTLYPVSVIPPMLVGGFFLRLDNVPVYFIWLQYISFFFYAYMPIVISQFEDEDFYCDDDEYVGQPPNRVCPITNGDDVIKDWGFESFEIWQGFLGMVVAYFVLRFIGYCALLLLAKRKAAL